MTIISALVAWTYTLVFDMIYAVARKKTAKQTTRVVEIPPELADAWSSFCAQHAIVSRTVVGRILTWYMTASDEDRRRASSAPPETVAEHAATLRAMADALDPSMRVLLDRPLLGKDAANRLLAKSQLPAQARGQALKQ